MRTLIRFSKFNVAGALGIGVQLSVLWALVDVLGVDYLVATFAAVLSAVTHNFLWHWRWTWADRALPMSRLPGAFVRFATANGLVSMAGNLAIMAALVGTLALSPVVANLIAIAACGLINFRLADRLVFRPCSERA
jgi:putative flippase GtrA